jgi:hypothetical protein
MAYFSWVEQVLTFGTGFLFTSASGCAQQCSGIQAGDLAVALDGYGNDMTSTIASVDCSCVAVPKCGCGPYAYEGLNNAASRAVTDPVSCKTYFEERDFEGRDTTQLNSLPIEHCDGLMNEVVVCQTVLSTIGVLGNYDLCFFLFELFQFTPIISIINPFILLFYYLK